MKYISSCWEDQRLSAEGKIVSKYCHISKTRGRGSINPTCIMVGVWLSLYVRGLTLIRHDYFGRKLRSHESLWYRLLHNIRKLKQRRRRGNENGKKKIDLLSKTTTLHVQHTCFCTFLCHYSTNTTWKCLISRFMLEVKTRQRFSFSFCELRNSPWEFNSWNIRQHLRN